MASKGVTPARQSIFALLSGLERDARDLLIERLPYDAVGSDPLGPELTARATERLVKANDTAGPHSWHDLLEYTDIGDALQLLNRHRKHIDDYVEDLKIIDGQSEALIAVRNRLAHTRPLHEGDLPTVLELSRRLVSTQGRWPELESTYVRLGEDPSFLLAIDIPTVDERRVHNLPTPEWDETGFLGRRDLVKKVKRSLKSAYPVVSIVGEGGLGKSAVALRVAYDVIDSEEDDYDAVVWTSAKTTRLTSAEVQRVEDAITTSMGLLQDVAHELSGEDDTSNALETILDYLENFSILLILDNLETVLDERLEDFFARVPSGSRILTTSRIGLGKFEVPIKIGPMNAQEGSRLIRALARNRGIEDLYSASDERLNRYLTKLNFNPGAIRWFVSVVSTGVRPEDAVRNQGTFVDFCMTNIYEYLSEEAKALLRVLLCVPSSLTQPEIAHFSDTDVERLQRALVELMRTNTVRRTTLQSGVANESAYELNELARQYLARHHPATPLEYDFANRKRDELELHGRKLSSEQRRPYDWTSMRVRGRSDVAVARKLRSVIDFLALDQAVEAIREAEAARDLAPEYAESHRFLAHSLAALGDIGGARESFEAAIDCARQDPVQLFHYGVFLSQQIGYLPEARQYLEEAARLSDSAIEVMIELATVMLREGDLYGAYPVIDHVYKSTPESSDQARRILAVRVAYYLANISERLSADDTLDGIAYLEDLVASLEQSPSTLLSPETRQELRRLETMKDETVGYMPSAVFAQWMSGLREIRRLISPRRVDDEADVLDDDARGTIKEVHDTFGFVRGWDGKDYFFHKSHLKAGCEFASLRPGLLVQFQATHGARGYRALRVGLG